VVAERDFLALLEDEDRRALHELGTTAEAAEGEAVLQQGDAADRVLVLTAGRCKVVASTPAGTHAVLGFRGPGALLGELALIDGSPRGAAVVAVEPVEMMVIGASVFRTYLAERPAASMALLAMLSRRLRDSDRRLAQFAAADTLGRLCGRLGELCEDHGEPGEDGAVHITLPITQEDLASWIGASIEATARALRQLRQLGWITTGRRAIVVHDVSAMLARAA
jgi:CRP-like cAMP-binding protein